MTSVRNHRLRSNGNNCCGLIAAAVLLLIASCTPKVRVLRTPDAQVPPPTTKPTDEATPATGEDSPAEVNRIALLLPFELDKVNSQAPSAADIKRSALALDFYQGFKLGLDDLAAEGANFRVHVLDTRDDVGENARLAKLEEVREAALVVGPVYPKEIQVFGFNAGLKDILQISPLAASAPSEFNLPNLVTMTAPLPVHIDALARHLATQYQAGDVILLYDTQDAASQQFLTPLRTAIRQVIKQAKVVDVQDDATLEQHVQLSGKNLVVVATTNRYQLSPILAHLRKLSDELNYRIQLYGHPNWAKLEFADSDGLAALRARITSSYYIDPESSEVRRFDRQYQQAFGIAPTEFAYKGYDAARYFGRLLAQYGPGYRKHLERESGQGLHNAFSFSYNPEWGYVNRAVTILQYGHGQFRPIN